MASCVLLAVGLNADEKMYVLREYIEMLQQNFFDCDIYAGINFGAPDQIENMFDESGLNITYARLTDERFHVKSDAAGFQIALNLMMNSQKKCHIFSKNSMNSQKKYDVVWFVHTKGGHNERDNIRQLYMDGFFPKRRYIEQKFSELKHLGVFGYRAIHYNWNNETNDKCLGVPDKLIRDIWDGNPTEIMPYTFCKYIVIETMFAMKAEILYKYFKEYPEFFDTPIDRFPTGRWFIELELCNIIPTRMGYYPVVFYDYSDHFNRELQFTIDNWIKENKLYHLKAYKTKLEDRYEHRN